VSLCENIIPLGCTLTMCMDVGWGLSLGVATALQDFILTQRHRGHRAFAEDMIYIYEHSRAIRAYSRYAEGR
jgi:hypothetical protein